MTPVKATGMRRAEVTNQPMRPRWNAPMIVGRA
jgi:hypothetical protein